MCVQLCLPYTVHVYIYQYIIPILVFNRFPNTLSEASLSLQVYHSGGYTELNEFLKIIFGSACNCFNHGAQGMSQRCHLELFVVFYWAFPE